MKTVLSVGSGSKFIKLPSVYDEYGIKTLDIDSNVDPDLCMDALDLTKYEGEKFDSVYNSHNLEHFRHCHVNQVLRGFHHILKDDGFALIIVPNVYNTIKQMIENELDLDAVVYEVQRGVVTVRDILWGHSGEIQVQQDNEWFIHKTGFSKRLLSHALYDAGFKSINVREVGYDLIAVAFKKQLEYIPDFNVGEEDNVKDGISTV